MQSTAAEPRHPLRQGSLSRIVAPWTSAGQVRKALQGSPRPGRENATPCMSSKRRWSPWVFLVAVLLSTFLGLLLHPRAFVVAAALSTILLVGVAGPWFSLRGPRGTLSFPQRRAEVGRNLAVRLDAHCGWPWHIYGLVVAAGWLEEAFSVAATLANVFLQSGCRVGLQFDATRSHRAEAAGDLASMFDAVARFSGEAALSLPPFFRAFDRLGRSLSRWTGGTRPLVGSGNMPPVS